MIQCYRCHKEISVNSVLRHHILCPCCSSALHCCKNCLYYDEFSPHKCSEPSADWVPDKEKPNFCEFFEFSKPEIMKKDPEIDKARAYWETLWKKAQ